MPVDRIVDKYLKDVQVVVDTIVTDEAKAVVIQKVLDTKKLRRDYQDCNVFGIRQMAKLAGISEQAMQHRLDAGSYYHAHQKKISAPGKAPYYLHMTHVDSGTYGNYRYDQHVSEEARKRFEEMLSRPWGGRGKE